MAKRPRSTRQASPRSLAEAAAAASAPRRSAPIHKEGGRLVYNVHDFLANKLATEIVGGIYPPGTLFPNESELRARFGVSRTALREAFRVLTAKGLIVSRTKVGTRVRPKADWNMLDPDVLAWHLQAALSEDFVTDLFELRQMVEPQAAALAAQSCDEATLGDIEAAYADMVRYQNGSDDLIDADLRFHQTILEATGNHFIGALGGLIHTALVGSFQLGWESASFMQNDRLLQHRAVLDAIRDRNPEQAHAQMAALLRDSVDDVKRALRSRGSASTGASPVLKRR
jgi:DNA-binding FadR family transcriptional regulator